MRHADARGDIGLCQTLPAGSRSRRRLRRRLRAAILRTARSLDAPTSSVPPPTAPRPHRVRPPGSFQAEADKSPPAATAALERDRRFLLLAMGMGAACAAIGVATIWSAVAGSP